MHFISSTLHLKTRPANILIVRFFCQLRQLWWCATTDPEAPQLFEIFAQPIPQGHNSCAKLLIAEQLTQCTLHTQQTLQHCSVQCTLHSAPHKQIYTIKCNNISRTAPTSLGRANLIFFLFISLPFIVCFSINGKIIFVERDDNKVDLTSRSHWVILCEFFTNTNCCRHSKWLCFCSPIPAD